MAETKGNGSIIRLEKDKPRGRCRKWQLRVPIGKDPLSGKCKTKTRRFEGTCTQAKAACAHIGEASLASITPAMLNKMHIAILKSDTLFGRKSAGSYDYSPQITMDIYAHVNMDAKREAGAAVGKVL